MKNGGMIGIIIAVVLVLGGIFIFAGGDDGEDEEMNTTNETSQSETATPAETGSTIVELAQATPDLSILVDAVVQANLVDTLSSDGPYTVFAPTNDAFAALLAELDISAEELLAREDLGAILTYHVVGAEAFSTDLSDGMVLTTVQGGTLTVNIGDAGVTITDANGNVATVAQADIDASNGVVHVIDTVVLP